VVAEARAADRFWGNIFGGTFGDPVNWQGGSAAGPGDVAHLGLTTNPLLLQRIYTVDFAANATNQALVIEDDFVTFDLNGNTYITTLASGNEIGTVSGRSGRLTITDGIMNVDLGSELFIGSVANAAGALTVTTGGELGSLGGKPLVVVGQLGSGTLTVENGGLIDSASVTIGNQAGSDGTATITGAASELTAEGLVIGGAGTGTLNIDGGSVTSASPVIIGEAAGSQGEVNVTTGTLTIINNDNLGGTEVFVGNSGTGTLNVEAGGHLSVMEVGMAVGRNPGSTGTVTILGTATIRFIGVRSGSTLNILDGGRIDAITSPGTAASLNIGGAVNVDGSGSVFDSDRDIWIGFTESEATLNVTNGGMVTVADFANIEIGLNPDSVGTLNITNGGVVRFAAFGKVLIGNEFNSDGVVNVSGPGSKLTCNELLFGGPFQSNGAATGALNITMGGEVTSTRSEIGIFERLGDVVTIDGAGSIWTNTGELDAGGLASAAIVVRNGAELRSGAMRVGQTGLGTLHVSSGAVVIVDDSIETASEPLSSGTIMVEDEGSTLTASDLYVGGSAGAAGGTGRIEIQDGSVNVDRLHVWETGDVQITGGTLNVASSLTTSVDGDLVFSGGTLSVPSNALQLAPQSFHWTGGTLHLVASDLTVGAGGLFGDSLLLNSRMNLQLDGALHVESGASLVAGGGDVSAAGGLNDGTLSLIGGSLTYTQPAVNNGNLDALRATLSFPGDGIANEIGLTNQGVLTLADTTVNGDVHSPAGSSIQVAGGVVFNGLVSGSGSFPGAGSVTFNGGFSPGDSPAAVPFGGDVTFGPNNALEIELAGTTPGAEYDQLLVADTASLDGILNVSLLGGFLPALGDSFTILTAGGGVSGTFADELLPTLAAGLEWDVLYNPNDVTLAVLSLGPDCILGDTGPCDGRVDIDDLNAVRNHFGAMGDPDGTLAGDAFPFDGLVNIDDLNAVRNNFGSVAAAVPEPSTCVLFCLCALFHLTAPRRR